MPPRRLFGWETPVVIGRVLVGPADAKRRRLVVGAADDLERGREPVADPVDLGEMQVRRALPSAKRQMVGPFIFFDQMGPAQFLTDQGIDVRPHPHINLATVTYLFEGQILHRDSLGTEKTIEPGAVNWMQAGRGIVHSERTSPERRRTGQRLFGIQTWMALPEEQEESDPAFVHHSSDELPTVATDGISRVSSQVRRSAPVRRLDPVRNAVCGRASRPWGAATDRSVLRGAGAIHDSRGDRGNR